MLLPTSGYGGRGFSTFLIRLEVVDQPTEQVSLSTRSRKEGRLIYRTPSGVVSSPRIGRHVRLFQVHISEWKLELAPAPTSYSPPTKLLAVNFCTSLQFTALANRTKHLLRYIAAAQFMRDESEEKCTRVFCVRFVLVHFQ